MTDNTGNISDGHHTFAELYDYRMLYHAHAAHGWLTAGIPVVKAWKHSDGEPCFGGGWFIVTATLPTGQVSNHYRAEHWDVFHVPEVDLPPAWDGHTPQVAADRLRAALDPTRMDVLAVDEVLGSGRRRPMTEPAPPVSKYRLTLTIEGNSHDEIEDELLAMTRGVYLLDSQGYKRDQWHVIGARTERVMEHINPAQTPEKYRAELDAWCERRWVARKREKFQ